jgi:Uma2 family endonuclease
MSLEQYEAMVASGIFTSKDRFELIEVLLVAKMTKYPAHTFATTACARLVDQLVIPCGWHARKKEPVRIPSRASEPEPNVAVARGDHRTYERRHPSAQDIALVVETAESSLEQDRKLAETYAAAGIPIYWIINIPDRQLEVFSSPVNGIYTVHQVRLETETVDLIIDGQMVGRIDVAELLPRPERSLS